MKGPRTADQDQPTLEQEVMFALVRLNEKLTGRWQQFFNRWNITLQQFNVLRVLYVRDEGEGLPCQEISHRLLTRVPDITRLLDRLEKQGLIDRSRSEKDRRVVRVRLTGQGAQVVEEAHKPILEQHARDFSHMKPEELQRLRRLLEKANA